MAAAATLALAGPSCGGDGDDSLDELLGYMPPDAEAVFVLSTDLESEQWQAVDTRLAGIQEGQSVEDLVRDTVEEEEGISYEEDVAPLLGGPLAVGQSLDGLIPTGEEEPQELFVIAIDTATRTRCDRCWRSSDSMSRAS